MWRRLIRSVLGRCSIYGECSAAVSDSWSLLNLFCIVNTDASEECDQIIEHYTWSTDFVDCKVVVWDRHYMAKALLQYASSTTCMIAATI